MKRDYYELLGVSKTATDAEIKSAYRKLAKELHPDRNPGDAAAEEQFKSVSEAYSVLIDENKRRTYDRMGHAGFSGDAGAPMDMRAVSEILEGLMGEVFGFNSARQRARQGNDIETDVEVSFEEAALGAEKSVTISRWLACGACDGSGATKGTRVLDCSVCQGRGETTHQRGFFSLSRPCSACSGLGKKPEQPCTSCKGRGSAKREEALMVKIPGGTQDGAIRSLKGQGDRSFSGGAAGDLHLRIVVRKHPFFARDGYDVRVSVPVSFPVAVMGGQIDVPTMEGKVTLKIAPGTPSGRILRVRDKGALKGSERGDLLVTTTVEIPAQVTRKQRELLQQLALEFGEDPPPEQRGFLEKLKGLFE